ncbi:uncharacterized protein LOC143582248, partial [Bidens hawaiensis]|uniref:uncharacterized protein LOC143582248 n=1 Tax=Bidens hawaiensis TaxID=980011 RepID=UPI00404B6599
MFLLRDLNHLNLANVRKEMAQLDSENEVSEKEDGNIARAVTVVQNPSPSKVLVSHLTCGVGLAAASFWLAIHVNLIQNPVETLRLLSLIEVPVVILVYSFFRKDKNQSSYLKAVVRGLLGLPLGAVVNALGAIALGAPVGT